MVTFGLGDGDGDNLLVCDVSTSSESTSSPERADPSAGIPLTSGDSYPEDSTTEGGIHMISEKVVVE